MTCRWYASWILVCSFFPLVVMYFLWIYYTASGQLKDRPYIEMNEKTVIEEKSNIADHYVEKDEEEVVNKQDENRKKENHDVEVGETK